ncbi:MAG: glucosaminidase domain-containing protein [Acidimicrobiia bacterium]
MPAAVVGLVLTLTSAALVSPAAAQQTSTSSSTSPPPTSTTAPASTPDPAVFRDLANQVARNEKQLADLTDQLDQVTAKLAQLTTELATTQQRLDETRAELDRMRQVVRSRAAFMYTHASSSAESVVDIEHVEDISSGKKYTESATRSDTGRIDRLKLLADQLEQHRREVDAARNDAQNDHDKIQNAKTALETQLAKQRKALDEAGAITVMGDATVTAETMASWFNSRGVRYRLMGNTTMTDLAQMYLEEGAAEHVRPELAFVQAVLETGSFGNATDNNFAGIGACDSCTGQIPFATPRDGVRGQIQMLRNYADPTSRAANLKNPPSAPIYGSDPFGAANAYDTFFAKGRVPTWNLMGNGNWATDPGYAPKVLTLYFQLLAYATRQP